MEEYPPKMDSTPLGPLNCLEQAGMEKFKMKIYVTRQAKRDLQGDDVISKKWRHKYR